MAVSNVGGRALHEPHQHSGQAKRSFVGRSVSTCSLDFSAVLYLSAGVNRSSKY